MNQAFCMVVFDIERILYTEHLGVDVCGELRRWFRLSRFAPPS
jgi:hypothetical protein